MILVSTRHILNVLEFELAIWKIFYLEVFGMFCFDGFVLFFFWDIPPGYASFWNFFLKQP